MADKNGKKPGLSLPGLRPGAVWQDLQNALTHLIRCNITLLDPQGKRILEPSYSTAFCNDPLKEKKPVVLPEGGDCVFQSFESCMLNDVTLHTCRHKVDFSTLKILFHDRVVAVVILGPFLMAEKTFPELAAFSQEHPLGGGPALSRDQIRSLRILTRERLTEIQNFVQCLFDSLLTLSRTHVPEIDSPGQ